MLCDNSINMLIGKQNELDRHRDMPNCYAQGCQFSERRLRGSLPFLLHSEGVILPMFIINISKVSDHSNRWP